MNMKPKTRRRLLLLAAIVVVIGAGAFGFIVVRRWQIDKRLTQWRTTGIEAYEAGDNAKALNNLGRYLKRTDEDPEALLAYAKVRAAVHEADGSHVFGAIRQYQRYLKFKPDDREARLALLKLYNAARYSVEARDTAQTLLPPIDQTTAADLEVLREEAVALLAMDDPGEQLRTVTERIISLDPRDFQGQFLYLSMLRKVGSPGEALAYAQKQHDEARDDPRTKLLLAMAIMLDHDGRDEAKLRHALALLCSAAGLDERTAARVAEVDYPDATYTLMLAQAFEGLSRHEHAMAVLADATRKIDDPEHIGELRLVRGLWQSGRTDQLLSRTEGVAEDAPAELLAFRAMALFDAGQRDGAKAITKTLADRAGDYRAKGWAIALDMYADAADLTPQEALSKLREAIEADPHEPVFLYFRGQRLAQLGRNDEARQAWATALRSPDVVGWITPRVLIAQTLLDDGRPDEAVVAAAQALRIAPNNIPASLAWLSANVTLLETGRPIRPTITQLLDHVDQAYRELAGREQVEPIPTYLEQLICDRVALLSRSGRREEAIAAVRDALARPEPLREATLLRLASISQTEHLGVERECLALSEQLHGQSPALAYEHAVELASAGKETEGLALLKDGQAAAGEDSLAWQIVTAKYLDKIGSPDAAAAWIALADGQPDNVAVQKMALASSTISGDRAFIERTIGRIKALTGLAAGLESEEMRLARARMLLHGEPSKRDYDEAVSLLGALVIDTPRLVEPRYLLAKTLARGHPASGTPPDLPGAVEHMAVAAQLAPNVPGIALELARLYQTRQNYTAAGTVLQRIVSDPSTPIDTRQQAATLLMAQGDLTQAVSALESIVAMTKPDTPPAVLVQLAEAYRMVHRDDKALPLYKQLLESPLTNPDWVYSAADFYAGRGDAERARTILSGLDSLDLKPGVREFLLARFAARHAEPAEAVARFEDAIRVDPTNADAWRRYIGYEVDAGEPDAASAVAQRARAALPDHHEFAVIAEQTKLMASGDQQQDLGPMIQAMSNDPRGATAAQILKAVRDAQQSNAINNPASLRELADRFPDSLPLQLFIARHLMMLKPPAYDDANTIAGRAMRAFPRDPTPAKLAAQIALRQGRFDAMLSAATAWRDREPASSVEPHLAVAQASMYLGQPQRAIDELQPLMNDARKTLDSSLSVGVVNIYARSLLSLGRENEAKSMLAELLDKSATLRTRVWLDIAAWNVADPDRAAQWIDQAAGIITPDALQERLMLAVAWSTLADRFPNRREEMLGKALAVLNAIAERAGDTGPAAAMVAESIGIMHDQLGHTQQAEDAYNRAIKIDPSRVNALNNLAYILLEHDGDLARARDLAEQAVAATDPPNPDHLHTLGLIDERMAEVAARQGDQAASTKNLADAADAYSRAITLNPAHLDALFSLASIRERTGDLADAQTLYDQILSTPGLSSRQHAVALNNLADLLLRLNRDRADLDRARSLVGDAVAIMELPAFYDTLGRIEAAAGRHEQAVAAFRRALALSPDHASALIGLAGELGRGDGAERAKAGQIIRKLDALVGNGLVLSDEQARELARHRTSLAEGGQ